MDRGDEQAVAGRGRVPLLQGVDFFQEGACGQIKPVGEADKGLAGFDPVFRRGEAGGDFAVIVEKIRFPDDRVKQLAGPGRGGQAADAMPCFRRLLQAFAQKRRRVGADCGQQQFRGPLRPGRDGGGQAADFFPFDAKMGMSQHGLDDVPPLVRGQLAETAPAEVQIAGQGLDLRAGENLLVADQPVGNMGLEQGKLHRHAHGKHSDQHCRLCC